ncbi:hypothetical protein R3P38DRAFT_3459961 [Favolaschia claudopus]|uniref:Uncharacterized protein n=1 Tax=Favolaschia claudopus TaxID=2862362 RepID=A0AAV9ZH37_9AGAR
MQSHEYQDRGTNSASRRTALRRTQAEDKKGEEDMKDKGSPSTACTSLDAKPHPTPSAPTSTRHPTPAPIATIFVVIPLSQGAASTASASQTAPSTRLSSSACLFVKLSRSPSHPFTANEVQTTSTRLGCVRGRHDRSFLSLKARLRRSARKIKQEDDANTPRLATQEPLGNRGETRSRERQRKSPEVENDSNSETRTYGKGMMDGCVNGAWHREEGLEAVRETDGRYSSHPNRLVLWARGKRTPQEAPDPKQREILVIGTTNESADCSDDDGDGAGIREKRVPRRSQTWRLECRPSSKTLTASKTPYLGTTSEHDRRERGGRCMALGSQKRKRSMLATRDGGTDPSCLLVARQTSIRHEQEWWMGPRARVRLGCEDGDGEGQSSKRERLVLEDSAASSVSSRRRERAALRLVQAGRVVTCLLGGSSHNDLGMRSGDRSVREEQRHTSNRTRSVGKYARGSTWRVLMRSSTSSSAGEQNAEEKCAHQIHSDGSTNDFYKISGPRTGRPAPRRLLDRATENIELRGGEVSLLNPTKRSPFRPSESFEELKLKPCFGQAGKSLK